MAGEPVRVSMYDVGFGDCFLIRFPGEDRERRVLIDCGSIKKGTEGGTGAVVAQIIEDLSEDGDPHLDVVAASHRHRDHVSGFAEEAWRDVQVDEVWLPWTEDPDDPEARRILEEMAGFAMALQAEFDLLARVGGFSVGESELIGHVLANTLWLSNEDAMATLHRGFSGGTLGARRRFLSRAPEVLDTVALPGVVVHVLGPSREESVLADMDPPSGESFLRAAPVGGDGGDAVLPFAVDPSPEVVLPEELRALLARISRESALLGAVSLEKAVNNTSLMLAFEVGEAVLLFPGDAQWGAWKVNLDDPRAVGLLERTTFYKVGHHGSHNATPVSFVTDVFNAHGCTPWAAASVTPHGRFTEIPKHELLEELATRIGDPARVVRSDEPPGAQPPPGVTVVERDGETVRIDFEIPTT